MADYIERTAAIEAFEDGDPDIVEEYDGWDCGCEFGFSRTNIRTILQSVPTADVAPVIHGHWIRRGSSWYCSYCDKGYRITCGSVAANNHHFCPNCGAKMK